MKRRAPAKDVSWVPPLGPPRKDGPLEPPALDDAGDDAEETDTAPPYVISPGLGADVDADASAFFDDLGEPDETAAFLASVPGR